MNIIRSESGLKDAWGHAFKVGAAVSPEVIAIPRSQELIKTHFSSLTAENAMKMAVIQPEEDQWNWTMADSIANQARQWNIPMRGHTFLWHQQTPEWLFNDNGSIVSASKLESRLEDYILKMTERYGDIVYAWDVLNEVIDEEKGTPQGFRKSKWFEIAGPEIYLKAFQMAREAAPKARLFYNDYNIESGEKLNVTLRFLSDLLEKGAPIQGVGIQGHWNFEYPDDHILRNAIEKFSALGLEIELTEVDISLYRTAEKEPLFTTPPEERLLRQLKRYKNIFRIASDYPSVKNITTWGIADNHTWLDNFPVRNRKNWPLLFDEENQEKGIVPVLIDTGLNLID